MNRTPAIVALFAILSLLVADAQGQSVATCTRDYYPEQVRLTASQSPAPETKDSRGESFYLYPYNLHLTPHSTSGTQLAVRDEKGNPITGSIYFFGYDHSLLSIDANGYVTALRLETESEIGTWVHALFNGREAANACVVRVLSQDHDLDFTQITGNHTAIYYPTTIKSLDVNHYVLFYQIPDVDEYAYVIQSRLMGLVPFDSARQIIAVDIAESEASRVCGVSGNPIRLGWNINGDAWQNCFLVPLMPPVSPQWFIMYHEMGHDFTWPSYTFGRGLGPSELLNESLAAAMSLVTLRAILENPAGNPLHQETEQSLQKVYDANALYFRDRFSEWYALGADFSSIDPDVVTGLWLKYMDARGYPFARRFFMPLRPKYYADTSPIIDSIDALGLPGMNTFFAALVSAAYGSNLASVFSDEYHFPLNEPFFQFAYPMLSSILDAGYYLCGDAATDDFVDIDDVMFLINYIFLGGPEPSPYESADANCIGGVDIDDLVYLINYVFRGGPVPCADCL